MNRKSRRILPVMLVAVLVVPAVATAQRIGYLRVTPGTASVYAQWQGSRNDYYDVSVYDASGYMIQSISVYNCHALIDMLDTNTTYKLKVTPRNGSTQGSPDSLIFRTRTLQNGIECAPPQLVVDDFTATTVDLIWAAGFQESIWSLEYKEHSNTQWQLLFSVIGNNYTTISPLNPDTEYDIRLTAICTDTTLATTITVRTACNNASIPYNENFDSWTATASTFGSCWRRLSNTPQNTPTPAITNSRAYSGTNSLYMMSGSTYYSCAVLPPVAVPVDSLLLSFYIFRPDSLQSHRLLVGVLDDPADINTFSLVNIIETPASSWVKVEVPLTSYQGWGRYVALVSPNGETSAPFVDDISLDYAPSCARPSMVSATPTGGTGLYLHWLAVPGVQQYQVAVVPYGAAPQSGTVVTVSTNSYLMAGVAYNNRYDVYVRSLCGASDTSQWSDPCHVHPGSWSMRRNEIDSLMLCGTTLYDDGGFAGNYTSRQNSMVLLLPGTPGGMVTVQGTFAGAALYDHLYIFDDFGGSPGSPNQLCDIVSTTSGQQMPVGPFTATNPMGMLTVYFVSNSPDSYSGLELNVTCSSVCRSVTNLSVISYSTNGATLNWTPIGNESQWEIAYNNTRVVTNLRPYTINGLTAGTLYNVSVRPICGVGDTGAATSTSFTTPNDPSGPCNAPHCLATTQTTDTTAYVQWIGSGLFEVQHRLYGAQQWYPSVQVAAFYHTFTGLTPSTRYDWRVRKICPPSDTSDWDTSVFITNAVGAIDMASSSSVVVYPNPSRGEVNIHCRECTVNEVGVISLSGRYERLRYAEGRVDVSHLAAGVYYLQIVTTTDVHREKIVVGY